MLLKLQLCRSEVDSTSDSSFDFPHGGPGMNICNVMSLWTSESVSPPVCPWQYSSSETDGIIASELYNTVLSGLGPIIPIFIFSSISTP